MERSNVKMKIGCMIIVILVFCLGQVLAEPCGDVNSDGVTDIVDALLVAQYYVGLDPANFDATVADVNEDGVIDILDALVIAQFYVGLIPSLPECGETPTPTPGSGSVTYELQAEDELWSSGDVDTNHDGYTGTGFVNTDNSSGEWIEWSFDLSADSTAVCEFRYACENGARAMDLSINGGAGTNLPFPASGAWNTWAIQATDTVTLSAGLVTIRLTATTSGGPPNMDKMDITITGGVIIGPTETPELTPTPTPEPTPEGATPTPYIGSDKPRVIVTTDIGGSDPDDFQSMVHYLLYTDVLDTEGLISSPHSTGRKESILEVIDRYEDDYANLITHSPDYPTPDELRAITKNGAPGSEKGGSGQRLGDPSEGSQLIVEAALRDDPRPLFVLVWGSIGDVAQAVHDVPQIKSKIRVYFIGGPNKKGCTDTYNYLEVNHKDLWIIENNSTYRGFFNGGNMSGSYSNGGFVSTHVRGHGALGNYFNSKKSDIKMGDTPSVTYVLNNDLDDPTQPGWGGAFVRAWERSHLIEYEVKTGGVMERFGVYELQIPVGDVVDPWANIDVANQNRPGFVVNGIMELRCSSKNAGTLSYRTTSNIPALDDKSGSFRAVQPSPDQANHPSSLHPNWWTDNPDPDLQEGSEQGAKTVNQWRTQFLDDFEARMDRAQAPK